MNRLREKTTATLLIAIFMISALAVASAASTVELGVKGDATAEIADSSYGKSVHLETLSSVGTGDEGRIVITANFPLADLETISWMIYTYDGYPAHVDIYLTGGIVLTAEMASNNPGNLGILQIDALMTTPAWLKTFETSSSNGDVDVSGSTILHDATQGAGISDAPFGTLDDWQAGTGISNPGSDVVYDVSGTNIIKFEIEADNWVAQSNVLVDNVDINGVLYDFEPKSSASVESVVRDPVVSIMVDPTSVDFGTIISGRDSDIKTVIVTNSGEVDVTVEADIVETGTFYQDCLFIVGKGRSPWTNLPGIEYGLELTVELQLRVPSNYAADSYEGIIVFEATPSPPP